MHQDSLSAATSAARTLFHGLRTYPLQELNDGFLVLLCSAVQVLQPELQLSPCVFEHTRVTENLLAVEPCEVRTELLSVHLHKCQTNVLEHRCTS